MAKSYKKKIYMINDSRDSEKCNDIRKYINSSNRQSNKREVRQNMVQHEDAIWQDRLDRRYGWYTENWREWPHITMNSIGGKFIHSLMRLGVLEGGDVRSLADIRRLGYHHHPQYELLEKLATTPDGIIL